MSTRKTKRPIAIEHYTHKVDVSSPGGDSELCPCGLPKGHDAGAEFFVSCRKGTANGLVLGPYDTHEEALANVERGREMAEKADPWSLFYAFGTLSVKPDFVGRYKGALGR